LALTGTKQKTNTMNKHYFRSGMSPSLIGWILIVLKSALPT